MSKFIHKSHNVSILLYHLVCPAKYRRVVFTDEVDGVLRDTCIETSKRFEIVFENWSRFGSCSFSDSASTFIWSYKDCENDKEYHRTRDFQEGAIGARTAMG